MSLRSHAELEYPRTALPPTNSGPILARLAPTDPGRVSVLSYDAHDTAGPAIPRAQTRRAGVFTQLEGGRKGRYLTACGWNAGAPYGYVKSFVARHL